MLYRRSLLMLPLLSVHARAQSEPVSIEWEPFVKNNRYGFNLKLSSVLPEVESFVVTIRYQLCGETVVRERKLSVLRSFESSQTSFSFQTSGPGFIVQTKTREMVLRPDGEGEKVANW
jgi:hypothetical protein